MRRASLRRLLGLTCHSGVLTDFKIMMQKSCYYIQQDPGSLCAKSRGAKPGVHAEAILCSSFLLNTGEIHIIPCLEPIFECRIHLCCLLCSWLQPDVTSLYNTGPYEREIKKEKKKQLPTVINLQNGKSPTIMRLLTAAHGRTELCFFKIRQKEPHNSLICCSLW